MSARLLNVKEVAAYLNVSVEWVYSHSTGKCDPELPSIKIGKYRRYRMDKLERWTAQRQNAA